MSFSPNYLKHLEVLQNVGMTRIDPVMYQGVEIVPLQFLKAVLPNPSDLGKTTKGRTCIGNVITGLKDGKAKAIYIYNICDHEACFAEVGSQAISYTTAARVYNAMVPSLEATIRKEVLLKTNHYLNSQAFQKKR